MAAGDKIIIAVYNQVPRRLVGYLCCPEINYDDVRRVEQFVISTRTMFSEVNIELGMPSDEFVPNTSIVLFKNVNDLYMLTRRQSKIKPYNFRAFDYVHGMKRLWRKLSILKANFPGHTVMRR